MRRNKERARRFQVQATQGAALRLPFCGIENAQPITNFFRKTTLRLTHREIRLEESTEHVRYT